MEHDQGKTLLCALQRKGGREGGHVAVPATEETDAVHLQRWMGPDSYLTDLTDGSTGRQIDSSNLCLFSRICPQKKQKKKTGEGYVYENHTY